MSIYIAEKKFCVYLTIYSGNKLPPFYIGSTSIVKIKNGYHGTIKSKKYGPTWRQELKDNPHLFRTIILYTFYSRKNALYNEKLLQIQFNVVKSSKFINMAIAKVNGFFGMDVKGENNPNFGNKLSEKIIHKLSTYERTEETREKMRLSGKKKYFSEEHRKNISIRNAGKRSGENSNFSKPVTINGIYYVSKKSACDALNVTKRQLNKLLETQ